MGLGPSFLPRRADYLYLSKLHFAALTSGFNNDIKTSHKILNKTQKQTPVLNHIHSFS
uniref:Uncharacterized protein n=1 Tax=Anguilla anguilla TaxID=7936 RepID=A0A0E9UFH1_ANGAN